MSTAYENGCLPASLMTKREIIAVQILAGLAANNEAWANSSLPALAKAAVEQGDALLAILAGPEES